MIRTRVAWLATAAILWAALVACGGADAAPTDGGSPSPLPTPNASSTETPANAIGYEDNSGFRNNQVVVINKTPGKLKLRANIQLDRITGPAVQPANTAIAIGEACTGCQTIAVALQLALYAKGTAHDVSPTNAAVAVNAGCNGCVTIAHAAQYVLGVDDPKQDIADVRALIGAMERELNAIDADKSVTADQAEARVRAVIARFDALATSLREDIKRTDVSDTPSAAPSGSPAAAPSASPTEASAAPSASPTEAPSTPSPTPSASP